jgi:hypothetical protein
MHRSKARRGLQKVIMDKTSELPFGAKCIEFSDFVIEQGMDKIVTLDKSAGDHSMASEGITCKTPE